MQVAKQAEIEKAEFDQSEIEYVSYGGEHHLPLIMRLVDDELSEPYSIFTYRYFVYLWPQLCFLAFHRGRCIGTVVCKMGDHRHTFRGYIAMLVVINPYRGRGIATELVTRSIKVMMESGCEEVAHHLFPSNTIMLYAALWLLECTDHNAEWVAISPQYYVVEGKLGLWVGKYVARARNPWHVYFGKTGTGYCSPN